MKNRVLFILILVLLLSFYVKSVSANELCSSNGYTVLTANGIFTDKNGAIYNRNQLARKFLPTHNNEPLIIDYIYNPTHLAGVGDVIDAVAQGLFDQKSDYDLVEMLNDASQKVTTQKLLLVGHSQGNFYANNFYEKVASQPGGVPNQSMGVYGVASPADYVAGGGKYLTSDTDNVIASLVARFIKILSPNIHIPLQSADGNGHSFSDVYLKYQGDRVVSDIKSSLDKLQNNDEQLSEDPCISPPELSVAHKIQGVILAVADPTAGIVKGGMIGAYNAGVYIANAAYSTGLAIGNSFRGLFLANVIESLPNTNDTATTLPETSSSAEDNSSPEIINEPTADEAIITTTAENFPNQNTETTVVSQPLVNSNPPIVFPGGAGGGGGTGSDDNNGGGGSGGKDSSTKDTIAPVITITGINPVDVTKGTTYTDAGATATDETDGVRTVNTTGSVDTTTIGVYTLTYTTSDISGNTATATRTVNIIADAVAPVITMLGNDIEVVTRNSTYTDAGATASDNVDGDLTSSIIKSGTFVDTTSAGRYTIIYSSTDLSGNIETKTRTIVVDDGAKLDHPNFVTVSGDYAYVVSDTSNSLEIINVSNPATLIHKSSLVHNNDTIQLYQPKAVAVSGNYAYVVSYSNNLNVIDISNPILPVIKSTLNNSDGGVALNNPVSLVVEGNYAYIASYGGHSLEIIDISSPTNPAHAGNIYGNGSSALTRPVSVFVSGSYAYVVSSGSNNLEIFNISHPTAPSRVGILYDGVGGASISNPQSIFVSGNYAYIASRGDNTFEIINVSDPTAPVHSGKIANSAGGAALSAPVSVFISGDYAYVSSFVGDNIEIINISDKANPVHAGKLANNIGGSAIANPKSVFVSGGYAYIASNTSNALEVVDISDPTNPIHKNKILDKEFTRSDPPPPPVNTATQLRIITAPQTIAVNTASNVITVESQNGSGELTKVTSTTYVNLSSSSVTGLFASSPASGPCNDDWTKTKVTIATGDAHKSFCYKDSTPGTPTITVSADSLSSDSQTFIISSPPE